jgi:hypothetical protein
LSLTVGRGASKRHKLAEEILILLRMAPVI